MIWHIFRKDVRLLWWMPAGVFALYLLKLLVPAAGFAPVNRGEVMEAVSALLTVSGALLIVTLIQNDALPGLRQDWLARPIPRRDLMLSKLVFILLLIQCPIMLADFSKGLADGFPAGLSLNAALDQNVWLMVSVTLPLLAFATLTRNLLEAVAGVLVVGFVVLFFLAPGYAVTLNSSIHWIPEAFQGLSTLAGVVVILWLQYFGRKTTTSRWVCGVTVVVGLAVQMIGWEPAFAIQQRFSAEPQAAVAVQLGMDPFNKAVMVDDRGLLAHLDIPMTITGVGPNETLRDDRTEGRIVEPDGTSLPLGRTTFDGHSFSYDNRFTVVTIARDSLKQAGARLELDYSLTLFRETAHPEMSVNEIKAIDRMGICSTTSTAGSLEVELDCRFGLQPTLAIWSLVVPELDSSRVHPTTWHKEYTPWLRDGFTSERSEFRIANRQAMRDPEARQKAAEELRGGHLVMKAYEPIAHFKRQVSIPMSKLAP